MNPGYNAARGPAAISPRYERKTSLMIASPCIGLCRMDENSGLCLGCARTSGEITTWSQVTPDARSRVWAELPARRARLGLGVHRLEWGRDEVRSFILDTLRPGGGTWVSGVYGAVAEFFVGAHEAIELEAGDTHVNASTARGAIAFRLLDHVRAFAFGSAPQPAGSDIIILAIARGRAKLAAEFGLTCLGPDSEAIARFNRDETLYDFGLGRTIAGFGIRTAEPGLLSRLDTCIGLKWPELLASIGGDILHASPTRVVRNSIGRIEVFTPIPAADGRSSPGPHTHFLPKHLAAERDLPPNLELSDAYVACAIHYPAALRTNPLGEC
jgi:predicted Fe-S protein YdhL (DUF1289 family)